jgi:hypothetical protein
MRPIALLLLAALARAAPGTVPPEASSSNAGNRQSVIVVVGAGGIESYADQFAASAGLWRQACAEGNAEFTPIGLDEAASVSDRARIEQRLGQQTLETTASLWLVLIGHGSYDGRTAKFNLRGPDVSAEDLAAWLAPVRRPVAVINTASASAPFLKALSAPGRTVITATKSGFERNYTRFGRYLSEAIADQAADLDKDGQTSLLEAFLAASHNVEQFYATAGRLATEHALLDDNGDGLGTPADWFRGIRPVQRARDDASLDGYRAHQLHLVPSEVEANMPAEWRARRDRLELDVLRLRDKKDEFSEAAYFARLESLLLELAEVYEECDTAPATVD